MILWISRPSRTELRAAGSCVLLHPETTHDSASIRRKDHLRREAALPAAMNMVKLCEAAMTFRAWFLCPVMFHISLLLGLEYHCSLQQIFEADVKRIPKKGTSIPTPVKTRPNGMKLLQGGAPVS